MNYQEKYEKLSVIPFSSLRLHRQQHNQHLLQRQTLRRNAGIVIDVCHNLMLHKKIHQLVPILPILRYHPQVVIKKSIAHIPLYPPLTRSRCRHFPTLPRQLPEFVRLHVIPWVIHRREVLLPRLHEEGAESALVY